MGFISTVVGLTASMLALFGSGAIIIFSIFLAMTIHPAFWAGILLFPVWVAACIQVIEWSFDL